MEWLEQLIDETLAFKVDQLSRWTDGALYCDKAIGS
jgi:hypothetical protein